MPRKALKPCKHSGCPRLTEGVYCDEHKPLHPDRPSATKRGYSSKWQRVSIIDREYNVIAGHGRIMAAIPSATPRRRTPWSLIPSAAAARRSWRVNR
ncbi:hypothetical protein [Ruminococcus sp.]|uniref:hypothetical protein n=1 Tax=Ruminococcus sp. TaxID=41978 RepID=UPI0025E35598|nr:hypothetical protein [Ruminococcus sp.]